MYDFKINIGERYLAIYSDTYALIQLTIRKHFNSI